MSAIANAATYDRQAGRARALPQLPSPRAALHARLRARGRQQAPRSAGRAARLGSCASAPRAARAQAAHQRAAPGRARAETNASPRAPLLNNFRHGACRWFKVADADQDGRVTGADAVA